jgi:serine O-acetyltransferase
VTREWLPSAATLHEDQGYSLWELVRSDLAASTHRRLLEEDVTLLWVLAIVKAIASPKVRVVIWYRIANRLARRKRWLWLAFAIRNHGIKMSGAELNPLASIGPGLHLAHSVGVGIGSHVQIGRNCKLHLGSVIGPQAIDDYSTPEKTVVGDDVFIGTHAVIIGGVTVGDRAVIGANAVVMRDVEAGVVVANSPGRAVGVRETGVGRGSGAGAPAGEPPCDPATQADSV